MVPFQSLFHIGGASIEVQQRDNFLEQGCSEPQNDDQHARLWNMKLIFERKSTICGESPSLPPFFLFVKKNRATHMGFLWFPYQGPSFYPCDVQMEQFRGLVRLRRRTAAAKGTAGQMARLRLFGAQAGKVAVFDGFPHASFKNTVETFKWVCVCVCVCE